MIEAFCLNPGKGIRVIKMQSLRYQNSQLLAFDVTCVPTHDSDDFLQFDLGQRDLLGVIKNDFGIATSSAGVWNLCPVTPRLPII